MIGTLLLLTTVTVTSPAPKDADLTCKDIQEIKFDKSGVYKDYHYDWVRMGEYIVWNGENVPNKIINTKEKTECLIDYPHIRSMKKFKDYELLFVDASRGKLEYTAVIEIKNCKKLWELEIKTEVSEVTFNSTMTVKNSIKGSVLDKCQHCWNEKTEACRNIPVTSKD